MDQRPSAGIARRFGDVSSAVDVNRFHLAAEDADKVHDCARAVDDTPHAVRISDVRLDETELADLAERLDEIGIARIARGDAHADPAFHQELADVAADESVPAEHRHQLFRALDHRRAFAVRTRR